VGDSQGRRSGARACRGTSHRSWTGDRAFIVSFLKRAALASACLIVSIAIQPPTAASADSVRNKQWYLKDLKISQAHALSKGTGIKVAVVDSGVDKHPDLAKNLGIGVNLVSGGSPVGQSDENGHGTAMAGIIVGHGKSANDGVLGIAPEAEAIPVKVVGAGQDGPGTELNKGIEWAAQNGAQVINVSAGSAPSVSLDQALDAAKESDALIVAATGNRPYSLRVSYPAASPGVLAVGAVDRTREHASFSVPGDAVQICAPGVDMETTGRKGTYVVSRGTSDSTAVVSGAAALVRSKFPDLTAPQVIDRLTSTATDIGPPGRDEECGFGLLNIVKALTADPPSAGGSSPPADSAPTAAAPAPDGDSHTAAIVAWTVGGVVVVLLGALISVLLVRRRKT
jgi:type VII secretion-associated serine protease mycosin